MPCPRHNHAAAAMPRHDPAAPCMPQCRRCARTRGCPRRLEPAAYAWWRRGAGSSRWVGEGEVQGAGGLELAGQISRCAARCLPNCQSCLLFARTLVCVESLPAICVACGCRHHARTGRSTSAGPSGRLLLAFFHRQSPRPLPVRPASPPVAMVAQPACATPAWEGMEVQTATDKVQESIRGVLSLMKANHPSDCM